MVSTSVSTTVIVSTSVNTSASRAVCELWNIWHRQPVLI
jgi:hypothetical protein